MRSRINSFTIVLSVLILAFGLLGFGWAKTVFRQAMPGYRYSFPADHASHPAFKTEWWYYTGHLRAKDGRPFGYELTFFRVGTGLKPLPNQSPWSMDQVYLAHFAVTDLQQNKFFHSEQLGRAGIHQAGANPKAYHVWNKIWFAKIDPKNPNRFTIRANTPEYSLDFSLTAVRPTIIHGRNGVSQKASCVGCASHYYSMTRLLTTGVITVGKERIPVRGLSWMDHEFGSNQMTQDQVGWDWFSIQLTGDKAIDNSAAATKGADVMLYQLRTKKGLPDNNSSGTWIEPDGRSQHLTLSQFQITPLGYWVSPETKGRYPSGWRVTIPAKKLSLTIQPLMDKQELATRMSNGVSYWEGACRVTGTQQGKPVSGQAYVELTGYAEAFKQAI